jgi:hypothetical protein
LTVLMLLGSAGFGIVKGGHLDAFLAAVSDTRNALANSAGFRITTVAINGRKHLNRTRYSRSVASMAAPRCCSSTPPPCATGSRPIRGSQMRPS